MAVTVSSVSRSVMLKFTTSNKTIASANANKTTAVHATQPKCPGKRKRANVNATPHPKFATSPQTKNGMQTFASVTASGRSKFDVPEKEKL